MTLAERLATLVFDGIRYKHWLYWPPGPMTGQVFDKDCCQRDIEKLIAEYEAEHKGRHESETTSRT